MVKVTWARVLTSTAVVPAALLAVAGTVALAVSPAASDAAYFAALLMAAGVAFASAFLVTGRLPRHPVGPLLAANGVVVLLLVADVWKAAAERRPDVLATMNTRVEEAISGHWMLLYLPLALVVLLFPDGKLPSPRWLPVAWALPGTVLVFNLAIVAGTVWDRLRAPLTAVAVTMPALLLVLLGATAWSVVVRYHAADRATRDRLRWLAVAGMIVPVTLLLCWLGYLLYDGPSLVLVGLLLAYLLLPCTVALALLRGDRIDVDGVFLSTVTIVLLGAVLLTLLSLLSGLTGLLVARWSTPAAVVVTVVCTLLVLPARTRLQSHLGRWVYPEQGRVLTALEELRVRVHRGESRPEEVARVLRTALRDPGLQVGYHPVAGGDLVWVDGHAPAVCDRAVKVRLAGEVVGVVVPGASRARRLPREATNATGLFVELVRLRSELKRALDAVAWSRARVLEAGDEERRRLERDLHDGAQQRLVSLGLSLRLLQRAHPEVMGLSDALDHAVEQVGAAVAELRALAHGLRPSSLDDGLEPALAELVRLCPIQIELDLQVGRLPDHVGTTAYFVVAEALTNAVRHAAASRIRLVVQQCPGDVRVSVSDDGLGGAIVRPGTGLAGLQDRVATYGGQLRVESTDRQGTLVEAVLPCES